MKNLIISTALLLITTTSFAETTIDIREADSISCLSNALGSFYLDDLNSKPFVVSSTKKYITITSKTRKTIFYRYNEYTGYNFKIEFNKIVPHEDESGHNYQKLAGSFINSDVISEIECLIE